MVFKCKMCGGTLEINQNESVAVCEYCGTKQTLPRLDDERRANLYDRANHFRRNNEFDKAAGIYEQILNEDSNDAEAYWSLVLCRYGIEYVEDPASRKRIPTVNRMQYISVFDDENYKLALQYADGEQRTVYEEEAKAINELQKGILAISEKEAPFDVFICYKETDASGRRTQDSVLANDLYHQLTQEGFKVFFSRITLEDKLGTAYEPYIFAALNSAKVMVVLGTKPEYFNAVGVRTEWSRYLALIKSGAKKALIPAYRDMDPYDLPEEFSHLQAQDMSKLGFMQDLIRGIRKIAQAESPKAAVQETAGQPAAGGSNAASLLKRAYMFLEDGDWVNADQYCEKVLDMEPENATGYLYKLMAELHVHRQEQLVDCEMPFDDRNNYQKAVRFADDGLAGKLKGYISHIRERNEKTRIELVYANAFNLMGRADTQAAFEEAARMFETIREHQDSAALAEQCHVRGEVCRKDETYKIAVSQMQRANIQAYETAIGLFETIFGWKDAEELAAACRKKVEKLTEKSKCKARRRKRIAVSVSAVIIIGIVTLLGISVARDVIYNRGVALYEESKYRQAYSAFKLIRGYKDSEEQMYHSQWQYGHSLWYYEEKYEEAMVELEAAHEYYSRLEYDEDDKYNDLYWLEDQIKEVDYRTKYTAAQALMDEGKYIEAIAAYEAMNNYNYEYGAYTNEGSRWPSIHEQEDACIIALYGEDFYDRVKDVMVIGKKYTFGSYEQNGNESDGSEEIEWTIVDRVLLGENGVEVLLVSEDALDYQPYNTSLSDVTWESSSLRQWLNESFLNAAFNEDERAMMMDTVVTSASNSESGNDVKDKVFVLSEEEAEDLGYYDGEADNRWLTTYARSKSPWAGKEYEYEHETPGFWLRSSGTPSKIAPIFVSYSVDRVTGESVFGKNSLYRGRTDYDFVWEFIYDHNDEMTSQILDELFGSTVSEHALNKKEFFIDTGITLYSVSSEIYNRYPDGYISGWSDGCNGVVPAMWISFEP